MVFHSLGKCFIFTCTADRQVLALRLECRRLVTIAWYAELRVYALSKFPCKFCTFFNCDSGNRNERKDIRRT